MEPSGVNFRDGRIGVHVEEGIGDRHPVKDLNSSSVEKGFNKNNPPRLFAVSKFFTNHTPSLHS